MSQTEESSRRLNPSGVRKRWEKIRGIEDEEENDTPRDYWELMPTGF
jgi:hypothetical protein